MIAPLRADKDKDKATGCVLVFRDVTQQRLMNRAILHHANHDPLTGLVNRREFERRLEHALSGCREHGVPHVLCYLDLDQFKVVNDTAGHAAGDEVLRQVRNVLTSRIRERDTLARLGGDEFGLLLENCPLDKGIEIAESLVTSMRSYRFTWREQPFPLGVSIGLTPITPAAESISHLLSGADIACYTAKSLGRDQIHVPTGPFESTWTSLVTVRTRKSRSIYPANP